MGKNLPAITSTKFQPAEVQLLKDGYFKGLNDFEISLALKQCDSMDLNPFNKEIYAYKIGGRLCLVTGISGFRKIAHRDQNYLGCKVTVLEDKEGKLISATATVKKAVKNHIAEFESTVRMDEFFNPANEKWKTQPENMLRIRAEAAALKMAFPNIEQLTDESNIVPVYEDTPSDIDVLPEYETQSQEVVQESKDPGLFKIPSGKNKDKFIKDVAPTELQEFLAWAYAQETLKPSWAAYRDNAEKFLKTLEN